MAKKYVYFFGGGKADGRGDMKDLLGGKGAGVAEMTNLGIPVPPGFTISTEACIAFYQNRERLPQSIDAEIHRNLERLERLTGKRLGDPEDPLLVSVRSGARFSMPGMMDTVLNLGLTDASVVGLARRTRNERFAYDSYRRFLAMFGDIVLGIPKEKFDALFEAKKTAAGAAADLDLTAQHLKRVSAAFQGLVERETGRPFPQDPSEQLRLARDAVFRSWHNPRAVYYRKQNNIPEHLGTAVNVQAMVFGNKGETSLTGVGFTRNPATGEKHFYGEYLTNAQGEDVVAGIRTPHPIADLRGTIPAVYAQLRRITKTLERHYRDVQDFEFTVEEGRLYMLQTRSGKRTAAAALKIAVDMVREKLITRDEALRRLAPQQLEQLLHPIIDPAARVHVIATGLPASPGAAVGHIVLDADTAVERARDGRRVILVRKETNPDDIHGMDVAQGILTARGGMTSHAAVVARQMGRPAVVGCEALHIDEDARLVRVKGLTLKEMDFLTLNGATGEVILGEAPLTRAELSGDFGTFMRWADAVARLYVRANADTPRDAKTARAYGARGIGLCRTEHMFFAEDRLPLMQGMILARTAEERRQWLDKLLPLQRGDFVEIFTAMAGFPVTIRLLDPPLHEFLPRREDLMVEITRWELTGGDAATLAQKKALLARVEELHEFNPMLGLRGCRLGITLPEISAMQVRAILEAAVVVAEQGRKVIPEIMIPLVSLESEMRAQRELAIAVATEVLQKARRRLPYAVGTMIELPRAALVADQIAREAEFFSFGTNDLTQTTFGFSRDDAGKVIRIYLDYAAYCPACEQVTLDKDGRCSACGHRVGERVGNLLVEDPFQTVDTAGVGALMRIGVTKGRAARPGLKVGICGEHGGDPASIAFCHEIGLDYVSCSPYRVPIARLAAAQAALADRARGARRARR